MTASGAEAALAVRLIRALKIALRRERRRHPRWHGNIPV